MRAGKKNLWFPPNINTSGSHRGKTKQNLDEILQCKLLRPIQQTTGLNSHRGLFTYLSCEHLKVLL